MKRTNPYRDMKRETKTLTFTRNYCECYCFTDPDGNEWVWENSNFGDTVIGGELCLAKKNTVFKISGYYIQDAGYNNIFRPRLLK